jgi:hypothetical protein
MPTDIQATPRVFIYGLEALLTGIQAVNNELGAWKSEKAEALGDKRRYSESYELHSVPLMSMWNGKRLGGLDGL